MLHHSVVISSLVCWLMVVSNAAPAEDLPTEFQLQYYYIAPANGTAQAKINLCYLTDDVALNDETIENAVLTAISEDQMDNIDLGSGNEVNDGICTCFEFNFDQALLPYGIKKIFILELNTASLIFITKSEFTTSEINFHGNSPIVANYKHINDNYLRIDGIDQIFGYFVDNSGVPQVCGDQSNNDRFVSICKKDVGDQIRVCNKNDGELAACSNDKIPSKNAIPCNNHDLIKNIIYDMDNKIIKKQASYDLIIDDSKICFLGNDCSGVDEATPNQISAISEDGISCEDAVLTVIKMTPLPVLTQTLEVTWKKKTDMPEYYLTTSQEGKSTGHIHIDCSAMPDDNECKSYVFDYDDTKSIDLTIAQYNTVTSKPEKTKTFTKYIKT